MGLNKAFLRIYRKNIKDGNDNYVVDERYACDRFQYIHSFHLLEKDLKILFDYVSPDSLNDGVFSHRIYELFLRSCTEFENNASAILEVNGYKSKNNFTIKDYYVINKAMYLSSYKVKLNIWGDRPLVLEPFKEWLSSHSLTWYQDYNTVKHRRTTNFQIANLKNLIYSMSGLISILYAQYGDISFSPYGPIGMADNETDYVTANDSVFELKPHSFDRSELYDFDVKDFDGNESPFRKFDF